MLDTTFVKVVCWDSNGWDCACRIVDLIWHMAREDAKAEGGTPAAARETGVEDQRALGNITLSSSGAAMAEVSSVSGRQRGSSLA